MVIEVIAALFVLLFLYTAITKFRDMKAFESAMRHSPIVGVYAYWLSWVIPLVESMIVILLLIPRLRIIGLILSVLIMTGFTIYIGYMLFIASDLPCTCGGILESMSWKEHFVFNTLFLALGVTGTILAHQRYYHDSRISRTPV